MGQTPVFRRAVDRVRVDVVVTDGSDRPIADLTREEFTIVENDRPQAITDFRFVSLPLASRVLDSGERTRPAMDVATNAPASSRSRLWAIMVDDLHMIEADIVPVKRILTDFARALPPEDEVAIVYFGRSDISVNFTSDPGRLLAAIDKVRDAVGFGLDAYPQRSRVTMEYVNRQARQTSDAIRNVAASLAGSGHARRAIVYVGTMTTVNPEEPPGAAYAIDELQRTFDEAKRSNVPVYTIDPRGHVVPQDAVRGGIGAINDERDRRILSANIRYQQAWLSTVAVNTGGRAFINRSDLTRAVHEIVAENGSFYELAYAPDPLPRDGKFHEFSVKVNRPGVRVRARQGYVAPGARAGAPSLQETAEASMTAGVNVAGLTLRAVATPLAVADDGMRTAITVELTYPLQPSGPPRIDDTLALSVYALDADAKVKARSVRHLRFAGVRPSQESIALLLDDAIDLPAQALTIRVGVASQLLGRAGTVQLPITVPNPDRPPQLSGVALGLVDKSAPALNGAAIAPIVPFQPTTARAFTASDTLRIFGRGFWKSTDAAHVVVEIAGMPATRQPAPLTASANPRGSQQSTFDVTVPLIGLPTGSYVLVVTARAGPAAGVVRQIPFSVRK